MDYTYYIAILLAGVLVVLGGQWFKFGVILFFKKIQYGNQVGLVFKRSLGNSFGFPEIYDLRQNKKETSKSLHPYTREQFSEGSFFGFPYMFVDTDDIQTSYGLYKQQVSEKGEPLFYSVTTKNEDGQIVSIKEIPVLDSAKSSVSVSGEVLHTAYSASALSGALQNFIDKHQLLMILIGLSILAGGIAAFFAFNISAGMEGICTQESMTATMETIKTACINATTP
jgi:hypothetical protein